MKAYSSKDLAGKISGLHAQSMQTPLQPVSPADVMTTSVIRLPVLDVKPFAYNPRKSGNQRKAEIKESIRARGLDQMFAVTKLGKDGPYVTAKGGCTRLVSLQELVQEGDTRFTEMDFLLVSYKNDSELLAAHLSENLHRSDMSFWDTAAGILQLRDELKKERSSAMSSREFAEALKLQGLSTSDTLLIDYKFCDTYLRSLADDYQQSVARNDIRYVLRPLQGALEAMWLKHGKSADAFQVLIKLWMSTYTDEAGYAADRLALYLQRQAALELGYAEDVLTLMLAALKADKDATLEELLIRPATDVPQQQDDQAQRAGADNHSGQSDGGTGQQSQESRDNQEDQDSWSRDGDPNGQDNQGARGPQAGQDFGNQGSQPGASGLRVASGLVPNAARTPQGPVAPTDPQLGGAGRQPDLTGMPPPAGTAGVASLEQALEALWFAVQDAADIVGIHATVLQAHTMPYGWLMEIPAAGALGVSSDDLAVQGWWLLANLSGQLHSQIDALLDAKDAHGNWILPDTGPAGYRAAYADESLWRDAVNHRLGGSTLLDLEFFLGITTGGNHPLTDAIVGIMACMRDVNRLRLAAQEGGLL